VFFGIIEPSISTSFDVVLNKPRIGGSKRKLSLIASSMLILSSIKSFQRLSIDNNRQTRLEIKDVVVSFPATKICLVNLTASSLDKCFESIFA
jgi:hypothetical protein